MNKKLLLKIKAMKVLIHTIIRESIEQGYTEIDISKPDDNGMVIKLKKENKTN